jgi:hypothetical protein
VVLGVIGAITGPKFRAMLYQSREGRTKSHLGDLRGAVAIYYSDHFGLYPSDEGTPDTRLVKSLVPQYLKKIPDVELTQHHFHHLNTVQDQIDDQGDWYYTTFRGFVAVNCTHLDTKGNPISSW